jgi:hypothetical protein
MSDHEARLSRDVYDHDHDHEEPRPSGGRRRRPVADWGVGDDVFEHMPHRRFPRAAEGPARERRFTPRGEGGERRGPDGPRDGDERGGAKDGRRTIVLGRDEDLPSEIAAITADRDLGDDDELDDVARPAAAAARTEGGATGADAGAARGATGADDAATAAPGAADDPPRQPGEQDGRRTVRIAGRPEGALGARFHEGSPRRRPRRSASDRHYARPDRLAAWAVALGVLLILIALLTAG